MKAKYNHYEWVNSDIKEKNCWIELRKWGIYWIYVEIYRAILWEIISLLREWID
jgi:hypothetical protein